MEHKVVDNNDKSVYPSEDKLNKEYSSPNSKDKTLGEMLIRRNKHLLRMFKNTLFDVELYGEAENPIIVINGEIKLSAFVDKFDLYFKSSWKEGSKIIRKTKISFKREIYNVFLTKFINDYEHEKWTKVQERIKNK